jgi:hypothetical protein
MKSSRNEEVRARVDSTFAQMAKTLEHAHPGVLEVMRVYGDYQAAVTQLNAYLAAFQAAPKFLTSNSTGTRIRVHGNLG